MAVSKRLRYEILRRDNHTCRYCGGVAPDVVLTVDHVVPTTLGGTDDPSNLVAACKDCNAGKSSVPAGAELVADVGQDAMRWAAAMQRASALAQIDRDARVVVEQAIWAVFDDYTVASYRGGGSLSGRLPGDWFVSVEQFMKGGLTQAEMVEAAYVAAEAKGVHVDDTWRYFCGICWKKIRRLQEAALALLAEEAPVATEHEPTAAEQQAYSDGWQMGHARALDRHNLEIGLYWSLSQVCDGAMLAKAGL